MQLSIVIDRRHDIKWAYPYIEGVERGLLSRNMALLGPPTTPL